MKAKTFLSQVTLTLVACALAFTVSAAEPKRVLVVTVTTEFRHSSIGVAEKTIAQIGEESGAFTVDYARQPTIQIPRKPNPPQKLKDGASEADQKKFETAQKKYEAELAAWDPEKAKAAQAEFDAAVKESLMKLSPDNLKKYDGVIFANTTGNLPLPDKQAFIDWVHAGHAFIAMHSGSDTFHPFRPYIEMLGGEFQTHGAQEVVECVNRDPEHPATKHFGKSFDIGGKREEMYIIKSYDPAKVHELLVMDKHPNTKQPGHYAVSWCKDFGTGKVFYTSLGHNEYVWQMPAYQKHILGGIKWALGLEKGDATPGN